MVKVALSINQDFVEKTLRDTWPLVLRDCCLKFIVLWTLFEIWIKDNSGKDKTRKALNWFKQNPNKLKRTYMTFWDSSSVKAQRNTFLTIGGKHGLVLKDNKDPNEVIEAIYAVRNNLVHGDWKLVDSPSSNSNDYQNLIYASAVILRWWLEAGNSDKIL